MEKISFDNLPQAVSSLYEKLTNIENLLLNQTNQHESDQLLTIKDASSLLHLSVPTIYGYVSRNEIPFSKRHNSKRLWFSKKELIEWLSQGRNKTNSEIISEAHTYLKKKKA